MNVQRFKTQVGQEYFRHRTVVETDPCVKGTLESRMIRHELLKYIAEDPFFSQCGGVDFEKCRIWHDGTRWTAEFEAVVMKPA